MKRTASVIISAFIILILTVPTVLAEFPDSSDLFLIKQGIGLSLNEQYAEAETLFSDLKLKYPDHPAGSFFLAATLLAQMSDYETFDDNDDFKKLIKATISQADKLRDGDRNSAWAYYFMGMANFYQALQGSRRSSKFSVLKQGIRGKNLLNKCLDLDSTLSDAYLGLGSYYYWGSVKTAGYDWLPFIGDNKQQGLDYLQIASQQSYFSTDLVNSALIRIYYNENLSQSADSLVNILESKFPQGKSFLWAQASGRFSALDFKGALKIYGQLRDRLKSENSMNNYNLFQIAFRRVQCFYELQEYTQTLIEIDICDNINLSKQIKKRHQSNLKELNKIKRDIQKKLEY